MDACVYPGSLSAVLKFHSIVSSTWLESLTQLDRNKYGTQKWDTFSPNDSTQMKKYSIYTHRSEKPHRRNKWPKRTTLPTPKQTQNIFFRWVQWGQQRSRHPGPERVLNDSRQRNPIHPSIPCYSSGWPWPRRMKGCLFILYSDSIPLHRYLACFLVFLSGLVELWLAVKFSVIFGL